MDENDVMQIGIVGVGGHGMGNVYPHVHNNPGMRIKAVCDLLEKQIEIGVKAFNPDYTTTDYNDMLRDPEIDAIVSSTHDPYHAPIAIDCMRGGKNVFIEKPMGITLEECQECIRTEKETGKFLQVGTNRRFAPIYMDARRALKEATISPELRKRGRNAPVIYYRICDDPRNTLFVFDPKLGGRWNREICHIFDVTTCFMESEPTTIYVVGDEDNRGVATITYENGGIVCIVLGGISHISMPKEALEIYAESVAIRVEMFLKMRVASDDCLPETYYHGFHGGKAGEIRTEGDCELTCFQNMQDTTRYYMEKGLYTAETTEERSKVWEELCAKGEQKPPPPENPYGGLDKGHYNEIEMFRRAVLSGGPSPIGAVDGARAFVMGRAAVESVRTGRPVEIDRSLYLF